MKLTPNQKELLACIKNKQIRKEVKKEFKKKITFYRTRWKLLDEIEPIVFENGKLETDNPKIQDFLSQHPMCKKNKLTDEFISPEKEYKVKVEIVKDEKLKGTGYENLFFKVTIPIGTPIQDSLNAVDEFFKQKTEIGNEIISNEKAKEIVLNNEYLQKVLSETHDVKFFRDLQNICVKRQNYEYATKFRQKVWDILVTLNVEKLMELVQNGTVELSDMIHAVGRQKIKFDTNDHTYHISEKNHLCWIYNRLINYGENPNVDYMHKLKEIALNFSAEKQFTLEDMRKAYFTAVIDYLKTNNGKHEYNGEILFKKFTESIKNPS